MVALLICAGEEGWWAEYAAGSILPPVVVLKAVVIDSYGNMKQIMFHLSYCPENWCH